MTTSLVDADSILVVDVGSVSTRAFLFDVVSGTYRFLAMGEAATTSRAPFHNIGEGLQMAIDRLQMITGRILVNEGEEIIIPSMADGSGVDKFVATISFGAPLKVVVVGLLEDVSLESAKRLAESTYTQISQVISLNDQRKIDTQINTFLRSRPDLIIASGGTENGASQSVIKLLESVGLACYLLPEENKPELLFVGNQSLKDEIESTMGNLVNIHFAPNIRPTLDVEQIDAARAQVANIYTDIKKQKIPGVESINNWARGGLSPTSTAFGRLIRFLSKVQTSKKSVLGIDVGASASTIAAALDGDLSLSVLPQFGIGSSLANLLKYVELEDIARWVDADVATEYLWDYLMNKSQYPSSIPATKDELAIEQALARILIQSAIKYSRNSFPAQISSTYEDLLPVFEPILASGSVLSRAPTLAQSVLMILDGIQPTGITTIILDQNGIATALGAASVSNTILPIHLLESNSFLHLGTVISPVGKARPGTPIMQIKMIQESGRETRLEVNQGTLQVLPLPYGQTARVQLQPYQRFDVGMGVSGRGGSLRVTGGSLGVIVDARGRPVQLPEDSLKRRQLFNQWMMSLGGS